MRLIDADKIVYMWQQDRNGKFRDGVTLESIVNDMPTVNANDLIIKELEKIKAEFEEIQLPRDNPYNNRTEYSVSMEELRELFGKHIAEPKGDDKPLN